MKSQLSLVTLSAAMFATIVGSVACKRDQPANQPVNGQQPNGYGPAPYGQQPAPQGGYNQPPPQGGYNSPPPAQTQPAAAGLPPSPLAPACQQLEGTCGFARCNLQAGRCAFPCNGPQDCVQGSSCLGVGTPIAVCTPGLGGAPQLEERALRRMEDEVFVRQ